MAMIKYTNAQGERTYLNPSYIVSVKLRAGRAEIELTTREVIPIEEESVDRIVREFNGEFI